MVVFARPSARAMAPIDRPAARKMAILVSFLVPETMRMNPHGNTP